MKATIDSLPRRQLPPLEEVSPVPGFSSTVVEVDGYVWPDLLRPSGSTSQVLLITAPGAMGKSAAARAVASALGAPLVDLARLRVGSNSLTGVLTRVLGWAQVPDYMNDLRAGQAALVLDSVDEAQLAAGRENFLAFLDDVAVLLEGAAPAHQLIMLGRRDAIETTYLALDERGISAEIAEVSPLDYSQSCDLINTTLDRRPPRGGQGFEVHRTHPGPFGDLRDYAFMQIAQALHADSDWDESEYWPEAESFLGYPPVLLALAERLAVDNPQAELSSGMRRERATTGSGPGDLLRGVVESILDRESDKVQENVAEAIRMASTDPRRRVLYGRDEQALRVLQLASRNDLKISAPAVLNSAERAVYEELVEGFVPDHPFLYEGSYANVVFSDYIRAFGVTNPVQAHGLNRDEFLACLPPVGPFFTPFVHTLASMDDSPPAVAEDLVSDLIRSNLAASREGAASYAHLSGGATLFVFDQGQPRGRGLLFEVSAPSGVLELQSPLARSMIVTRHGLIVTAPSGGSLDLGPEVVLLCDNLELFGQAFVATSGDGGEGAFGALILAQEVKHDPQVKVTAFPSTALQIAWPDSWHQWKPYVVTLPASAASDHLPPQTSELVFLGLRRILSGFHSSAGSEPSAYREKLERFSVGGNQVIKAVLTALRDLGIVADDGPLYRLKLDALSKYQVSYTALSGPESNKQLAALHNEVCKHEAVQAFEQG